ncbi:hypothetical protein [Pseudomonas phage Shamal]
MEAMATRAIYRLYVRFIRGEISRHDYLDRSDRIKERFLAP